MELTLPKQVFGESYQTERGKIVIKSLKSFKIVQ